MDAHSIQTIVYRALVLIIAVFLLMSAYPILAGIDCAGIAIIAVYGSMNAFFSIPGICSAGIAIITEMKEGRGLISNNGFIGAVHGDFWVL